MRVPKPRKLGAPDTIPLHPQTAGRNPDFMLIARSKLKSRHKGASAGQQCSQFLYSNDWPRGKVSGGG
jgi:hypothetical protein